MGKVYLVTGGTDGIGKSIVEKILGMSEGDDRILVNYGHNDAKAEALLDSLEDKEKERVTLLKADLSDYVTLKEFVKSVIKEVPEIDYLVLNIGIGEYAKFDDYTVEMWNRVLNTNLTMPVFLIKELKYIIKDGGGVLLMGSYAGKKEYSSSVVYSISKAGLLFLAKVLVKEFSEKSVRINALAPGFIETSWQKNRSDESRSRINSKIALHRFGKPEEVADMAISILHNTYMNGSIIDIHGGYEFF